MKKYANVKSKIGSLPTSARRASATESKQQKPGSARRTTEKREIPRIGSARASSKQKEETKLQQEKSKLRPPTALIPPSVKSHNIESAGNIANIQTRPIEQIIETRDLQNLQSKLNQWQLSNFLLERSFETQKEVAIRDIKDRFLQVYGLKQENFELQKVLQSAKKLEVIDQMVNVLSNDGILEIHGKQWPLFVKKLTSVNKLLDQDIN